MKITPFRVQPSCKNKKLSRLLAHDSLEDHLGATRRTDRLNVEL